MEVHFPPEVQAKLEQMARDTGRRSDQLVENVVTDFFEDFAFTRETYISSWVHRMQNPSAFVSRWMANHPKGRMVRISTHPEMEWSRNNAFIN